MNKMKPDDDIIDDNAAYTTTNHPVNAWLSGKTKRITALHCTASLLTTISAEIIGACFDHYIEPAIPSSENLKFCPNKVQATTNVAGRTVMSNTSTKLCNDLFLILSQYYTTQRKSLIEVDLVKLFKELPRFKQVMAIEALTYICNNENMFRRGSYRKIIFDTLRSVAAKLVPDPF